MPRRELFTPEERAALHAFSAEEAELIRLATLSRADVAFVRQHRGEHNRLGVAVQLCYLRYPGRVLTPDESPFPPLRGILAARLRVRPAVWDLGSA